MSDRHQHINRIFVICIGILLCIPGLMYFSGHGSYNSYELKYDQKPAFQDIFSGNKDLRSIYHTCKSLIDAYDSYYSKHFGLRFKLFGAFRHIKQDLFNSQVIPNKVIKGDEGWYFLGNDFSNEIKELMGLELFSEHELTQMENRFLELSEKLASSNTSFLVVIVPNKSTTYAQYVGWNFKENPCKKDQFLELISKMNIDYLDLTSTLVPQGVNTYYKTDSHWNSYGALISSISIFYHPKFEFNYKPKMEYYAPQETSYEQMDLTRMLAIKKPEHASNYKFKLKSKAIESQGLPDNIAFESAFDSRERHYTNESQITKVSLIGDSFSEGLIPYLKDYCGELHISAKNKFDVDFTENFPSDILILQVAERNLDKFIVKYWESNK